MLFLHRRLKLKSTSWQLLPDFIKEEYQLKLQNFEFSIRKSAKRTSKRQRKEQVLSRCCLLEGCVLESTPHIDVSSPGESFITIKELELPTRKQISASEHAFAPSVIFHIAVPPKKTAPIQYMHSCISCQRKLLLLFEKEYESVTLL